MHFLNSDLTKHDRIIMNFFTNFVILHVNGILDTATQILRTASAFGLCAGDFSFQRIHL